MELTSQHLAEVFGNGKTTIPPSSGATSHRPALGANDKGTLFFDETLGKPIWWTGAAWADIPPVAVIEGTTAQRPTQTTLGGALPPGFTYYDSTVAKLAVWTGAAWVDTAGVPV